MLKKYLDEEGNFLKEPVRTPDGKFYEKDVILKALVDKKIEFNFKEEAIKARDEELKKKKAKKK